MLSFSSLPKPSIYPSVQCKNQACYFWTNDPKPGSNCVKCTTLLPIWVGYLNADKGNETPSIPALPLERTHYQEMWFYDENENDNNAVSSLERSATCSIDETIHCSGPLQLKRTDGNDQEPPVTNKEQVIQDIMVMYRLGRERAIEKLDQMAKSVTVEYF